MKALIITGGFAPSFDHVKEEFEQADLIIAADSGLHALHQWNICPDLLVGDFDSVQREVYDLYPSITKVESSVYKDYSDTELALVEAQQRGANELVLIGGGEGRLDHSLALVFLFARSTAAPSPDRWYTRYETVRLLSKGRHQLDCSLDDTVSFFPFSKTQAESYGLEWNISSLGTRDLYCSLSNQVIKSCPSVIVHSGALLMICPYREELL